MTSLISELQNYVMDKTQHISDLLRKAKAVFTKLELAELQQWCNMEIDGYGGQKVPCYRVVKDELKTRNPGNGWVPVVMKDPEIQHLLSEREIYQPIVEIEDLALLKKLGPLQIELPHNLLMKFFGNSQEFQNGMMPIVMVDQNQVAGIVDEVRNILLQWSLKLESNGIVGKELEFSTEEVKKASQLNFSID